MTFPSVNRLLSKSKTSRYHAPLNNHPQHNLTVSKRAILNDGISLTRSAEVHVILAIRRRGRIYSTLPAARNTFGTLTVRGFNTLLIGTVSGHNVVLD